MNWIFDNDRPIYVQLVEQLEMDILSGNYPLGSKLPSVRELAELLKVNPNTMQRAFLELENKGLVFTKRTSGRFVTENKSLIDDLREEYAKRSIEVFKSAMQQLGFSEDEMVDHLKKKG